MQSVRYRLALIGAVACWGSSTAVTKHALGGFGALTLLVVQLLVANLVLWPFYLARRGSRRGTTRPGGMARFAVLGFFEPALAYAGLNFGLLYTSAANASLMSSLEALFVLLLAAWFLRERISRRAALGVALAVAGVVVLQGVQPVTALRAGDLLVAGGALSASIYVTLASRIAATAHPAAMTAFQFGFGLLFTLPVAAWQWLAHNETWPTATASQWTAAVIGALLSFALPFAFYNYAIASVPASSAGIALCLIPVFGLASAVAVLGESLSGAQLCGAGLIVAGLLMFRPATEKPATEQPATEKPATEQPPPAQVAEAGDREYSRIG